MREILLILLIVKFASLLLVHNFLVELELYFLDVLLVLLFTSLQRILKLILDIFKLLLSNLLQLANPVLLVFAAVLLIPS